MNYLILGAGGFIGRNLVESLMEVPDAALTLFDRDPIAYPVTSNCRCVTGNFGMDTDFAALTRDADVVYHLVSTTLPGNSNENMEKGFVDNVLATMRLLDACVANRVGKVVFISSGGTVYGMDAQPPLAESAPTDPINGYGLQKLTIEKTLYLYRYLHGLDYRIVRLSNPYGKYKKAYGIQGVVNTFVHKAVTGEALSVFGDGNVVRDYIHIDDAIAAIRNIEKYEGEHKLFNVGSGQGHSVKDIIALLEKILGKPLSVTYTPGRKADVPVNVLDVSRYESEFGPICTISLEDGIRELLERQTSEYAVN